MIIPSTTAKEKNRGITRRGLMLGGIQVGVFGVLAARMRQLQVTQSDQFRMLAEENRINIRLIPPARGLIFDRNGKPVAENHPNYRIVMIREQAGDAPFVLSELAKIIFLPEERQAKILENMRKHSAFVPVSVAENLEWEDFARVSANAPALPGIITEVGLNRFYPQADDYTHIVGYVGPVSDRDLERIENPDPVLQIPDFQIGKTGIENRREDTLRGTAGTSRIEVNSAGRVMRELSRIDGADGADLQLSIDSDLQHYAQYRLADQSAATVVMDIHSGDIRAMASAPSFDPNMFIFGISTTNWNALLNNEYRPLADKTISGAYPPGSTFKMMVALAALEDGLIEPDEKIFCPGYHDLGNRRFHCWRRGGHGRVNLHESLKYSCDVFYYEISQRVGIEKITAMARRFGFGEKPDLPLPAIAKGLVPTKQWKQDRYGEAWRIGDTLNSAIGQGFVLSSPIQLAVMAARIASGRKVEPRLIQRVNGVPQSLSRAPSLGISEENLNHVRMGMFKVSNENRGTAYSARIAEATMAMAGKTGTSQVRQITTEERAAGVTRNEDLPWDRRDHALFVGFAPYDNPRYAISVVVEHGGSGSGTAAPIARDIMLRALYETQPPLSAFPRAIRSKMREQRANEPPPNVTAPVPRNDRA
ncbi:MAG: penicillin-binding protein 2 [Rhodobacteraceae bacterium]|nr:penicillin-binding protein 2 [Paracoccaceae bacterium]